MAHCVKDWSCVCQPTNGLCTPAKSMDSSRNIRVSNFADNSVMNSTLAPSSKGPRIHYYYLPTTSAGNGNRMGCSGNSRILQGENPKVFFILR